MTTAPRGLLIALEGPDRVGKTTQLQLLADRFECVRFPNRGSPLSGLALTQLLNGSVQADARTSHMLFTTNRWEAMPFIQQQIQQSVDVALDRYCHSGVAYSVAQGVDPAWAWQTQTGLLCPDLIIYLRLDPAVAARRSGYGNEVLETTAIQTAVFDQYERWSATMSNWTTVDASDSVEEVHIRILRAIKQVESRRRTDLWVWK